MTRSHDEGEEAILGTPAAGDDVTGERKSMSRRQLFKLTGAGVLGAVAVCLVGTHPTQIVHAAPGVQTATRSLILPDAKGMVLSIPSRCVGCRRCELACSEFNLGKSQPTLSNVKVYRNMNFGVAGAQNAFWRGDGAFGNHLLVQETCRQCPHPVPCETVCPNGAIELDAKTNARVINAEKCVGCRLCQQACPWGMTSFDEELKVATKCHLCAGAPECVNACPTGALQYVPWEDTTRNVARRFAVPPYIRMADDVADSCAKCH